MAHLNSKYQTWLKICLNGSLIVPKDCKYWRYQSILKKSLRLSCKCFKAKTPLLNPSQLWLPNSKKPSLLTIKKKCISYQVWSISGIFHLRFKVIILKTLFKLSLKAFQDYSLCIRKSLSNRWSFTANILQGDSLGWLAIRNLRD